MRPITPIRRAAHTLLAIALLAGVASAADTSPVPQVPPDTKAIVPVLGTRSGKPTKGHVRFCEQAKAGGFDVLFLGDWITAKR